MTKRTILNRYHLGDMYASYYLHPDTKKVSILLEPDSQEENYRTSLDKESSNLARVNILEEPEALHFQYKNQEHIKEEDRQIVRTYLTEEKGYILIHELVWYTGMLAVEISTTIENQSNADITIEYLTSATLQLPFHNKQGKADWPFALHRIRTLDKYYELETIPFETTKFANLPLSQYIPFLAVEQLQSQIFTGIILKGRTPWQFEAFQTEDEVIIGGGVADYAIGHWRKILTIGSTYTSPTVLVSVCQGFGIDYLCDRLAQAKMTNQGSLSKNESPIVYEIKKMDDKKVIPENLERLLGSLSSKGITHVCLPNDIFAQENLREIIEDITKVGLVAGVSMNLLTVRSDEITFAWDEHLLKRDDILLMKRGCRIWDMRDSFVQGYLTVRLISSLKQYGIRYLELHNTHLQVIGCDGAESIGEGLRQQMEATHLFIQKMKKECSEAEIIVADEQVTITDQKRLLPIIAANKQRLTIPRYNQIKITLDRKDSLKQLAYQIASSFFGNISLIGEMKEFPKEKDELLSEGIMFYRMITPIILEGFTFRYGNYKTLGNHIYGWQGILRVGGHGGAFVVIHTFEADYPDWIEIPVPEEFATSIVSVYSDSLVEIRCVDGILRYRVDSSMRAVAVYLE